MADDVCLKKGKSLKVLPDEREIKRQDERKGGMRWMDMVMREAESCVLFGQIKAEKDQTNSFHVMDLLRVTRKSMKMRRNKIQEREAVVRQKERGRLEISCSPALSPPFNV